MTVVDTPVADAPTGGRTARTLGASILRPSWLNVGISTAVLLAVGLSDPVRAGWVGLGAGLFIAALGLVVVSGWTRQANLAQYGFVWVGAYAAAAVGDAPFPLRLLVGAAAASALAVPVGLAASRLRGLALGALTLLVGLTVWTLAQTPDVVGRVGGDTILGVRVDRPSLVTTDRSYALLALAIAAVALALVVAIGRSRTGRAMTALGTSRAALTAAAWDGRALVVASFAVSAAFAGAAGVVLGANYGSVSAADVAPFNSILLYALLFNAGADRPGAAAIAAGGIPAGAALGLGAFWLPVLGGLGLVYAGARMPEGFLNRADRTRAGRALRSR